MSYVQRKNIFKIDGKVRDHACDNPAIEPITSVPFNGCVLTVGIRMAAIRLVTLFPMSRWKIVRCFAAKYKQRDEARKNPAGPAESQSLGESDPDLERRKTAMDKFIDAWIDLQREQQR